MHKTTVEIDERLLKEAVDLSGAKSKKMAIEMGLRELIRSIQLKQLKKELGTYDLDQTVQDLERMRRSS